MHLQYSGNQMSSYEADRKKQHDAKMGEYNQKLRTYNRKRNLAVLFIILAVAIWPVTYFAVALPANYQYTQLYKSHVIMAGDQADFTGVMTQVQTVQNQMLTDFAGHNLNTTWNSYWYWDHTYDNSLQAEQDYFNRLEVRITNYQAIQAKLVSNGTVNIQDWIDQSMTSLRNEMNRSGGLDWALYGAWMLTFQPLAAWWFWWTLIPCAAFGLAALGSWPETKPDKPYD